ncbi:MAG: Rpn family recombination-promoting nuclease/putative transposase, partial [Treponema sp.]|nr:Rpn family recombination-promoting nuclease/putative transposase [Treponema sp.]
MSVNREYKNSVFSYLFGQPDTLRELYGALRGVEVPADVKIEINTLQDALFLDRINDLSFAIGKILVILIEHQSTINPNMAVRLLMYIARIYEKILGGENIYSGKHLTLPRPECIVLYNGTAPYPDTQTIRLSDSFEQAELPGLPRGTPAVELTAKIYNINEGRNPE